MARPAAVVDALEALQAFGAVEHAIKHPSIGMVVHAAGAARHPHYSVDDEGVVRIDIEQKIFAALGGRRVIQKKIQRVVRYQPFEQRLRPLHTALVCGLGSPDRAQFGDKFVEYRQSRVGHALSLFMQRLAFNGAAAQQPSLFLREIGAGVDGAAIVPHQKVAELPDVLEDEIAAFADLVSCSRMASLSCWLTPSMRVVISRSTNNVFR